MWILKDIVKRLEKSEKKENNVHRQRGFLKREQLNEVIFFNF